MESAEILGELERRGAQVQVVEGGRLWVPTDSKRRCNFRIIQTACPQFPGPIR